MSGQQNRSMASDRIVRIGSGLAVARVSVDLALVERPGVIDAARHKAHGALRELASMRAEDVELEAVTLIRSRDVERTFVRELEYAWMPALDSPVEFVGGHIDGQQADLKRDPAGYPPPVWQVPIPEDAFQFDAQLGPAGISRSASYQLIGFHPSPARWVYELSA